MAGTGAIYLKRLRPWEEFDRNNDGADCKQHHRVGEHRADDGRAKPRSVGPRAPPDPRIASDQQGTGA
jgi:hypothetical protein